MDESSLLDLLECSLCLKLLDTTARVLPCQHTCCRCLQSIVSSKNELCCPECRIVVECGANILLVRLLDGIWQRPRNSPTGSPTVGRHHCAGSNNSNNHSTGCAATGGTHPHTSSLRDSAAESQNVILLAKPHQGLCKRNVTPTEHSIKVCISKRHYFTSEPRHVPKQ
ncbi:unnamed protein product [Ranitomeya imitator]|uniref:RING-type domain-containing protein n=1 Tax=Ranitomeya imitator TaxID=111125 RepID=A0ABN9MDU5_9NEOB|nr:unnamed protein product [Ranitomeya imitator]